MCARAILLRIPAAVVVCLALSLGGASCAGGGKTGTTTSGPRCGTCPANSGCNADGSCSCLAGFGPCPGPDGGIACIDEMADDGNCGSCGNACPAGQDCQGGACVCQLTSCPLSDGGSVCIDPRTDQLNCKTCGHSCGAGGHCVAGSCSECDAGLVYCADAGSCVDITKDDANCSGCGIRCANDQHCAASDGGVGACFCNSGPAGTDVYYCDGACVDLDSDPFDCGACENVCTISDCIPGDAGTGVCECNAPFEWCGSTCVDTLDDFNHCGGCSPCFAPATECVDGGCH